MLKEYKNKEMKGEQTKNKKQNFFFPKENPPISIEAESIDEAVQILQANKNHNE